MSGSPDGRSAANRNKPHKSAYNNDALCKWCAALKKYCRRKSDSIIGLSFFSQSKWRGESDRQAFCANTWGQTLEQIETSWD
jgi:hypothetical protein